MKLLLLLLPLILSAQTAIGPSGTIGVSQKGTSAGSSGTVTVVGAGNLANTAIVTGGGTQTVQTPSTTATMDSSGNISTPGSLTTGSSSGVAGSISLQQGTAPAVIPNSFAWTAPTTVTNAIQLQAPNASPSNQFMFFPPPTSNVSQWSWATAGGTCTNQFIRSISTLIVPTCATIALADTPLTTRGDILVVNSTPALARLAKGTQYQTLQGGASDTLFDAVHLDQSTATLGLLALNRGGVNADLSATGGLSQVLKQTSSGGAISVARLACADLSDSGGGCSGASVSGNSVVNVTPVTATANTTSDQALMELTLTAGYFNSIRQPFLFSAAGIYTTPVAQTPTLTFKVKLCTVSGCGSGTVVTLASWTSTASLASVTNDQWNIWLKGYTATAGATGNLEAHGDLVIDLGSVTTAADSVFADTNTAVSSNIDLTAALFVNFTVTTSTGSASNAITQRSGAVMPFAATAAPVTSVNTKTGAVALTLNSSDFANEGTTTTILHGNAAGNPAFSAIVSNDLNITTTTCTYPSVLTAISATGTGTCTVPTIPQNSQSAAYTTVLGDAGKHLYHPGADTTARTWTIDSNANVAYPIGTTLTFVNDTSGGVITIAITSDTMILAGAGTTGSRTLAANGIATALKVTSTRWIINGTGLT